FPLPTGLGILRGMRDLRSVGAAVLAVVVLGLGSAGCGSGGSGGDDKPEKPAPTVTATQTVDRADAREACVDAWAQLLLDDSEAGVEDEPSECAGLPADDRLDRYMEGLQKRNAINRG
ncbi:hypothetical protein ACFVZD_41450, partial [Streptomyces sp. NPDC058287]|uniref:hypothetical protein n=1 Tax=Streptomyces sp. NPDC058287 TaxID=3346423 RepID=UPI0036EDCA9A